MAHEGSPISESIFKDPVQRDDMYGLAREGLKIDNLSLPLVGKPDQPHTFIDGSGDLLPVNLLKDQDAVANFSGKTLKSGPSHSHDPTHQYHYFETENKVKSSVGRFRKASKDFRDTRRNSPKQSG